MNKEDRLSLKKIDRFTIGIIRLVSIVALLYMISWTLTLMSVQVHMMGIIIFLIIFMGIPIIICCGFILVMFIIKYIKTKLPKRKNIIKTSCFAILTLLVVFLAHYILLKYCFFGSYEIKLNRKIKEINDVNLQSILTSSMKEYDNYQEFKVERLIIEPGIPDDYYLSIYYRDNNNKKNEEREFLSDSEGYKLVDEAEDLAEKYMPINVTLFILSIILVSGTCVYLSKEYVRISQNSKDENIIKEDEIEEKHLG